VSYLNSPRKGCPRGKTICVWTHLGLIKWKTISKKIRNARRPQKKMEDGLQKKNGRRPQKNKNKNFTKQMEDGQQQKKGRQPKKKY
jgi:hypothetical protein